MDGAYDLTGACPSFCTEATRERVVACPSTCSNFDYECAFECETAAFEEDASEPLTVPTATPYDLAFGQANLEVTCLTCVIAAELHCYTVACPDEQQAYDRCIIDNELGPDAEDVTVCDGPRRELDACAFASERTTVYDECYSSMEASCYVDHSL
jgi:hypothetical protein